METTEHLNRLREEGPRLAAAAGRAGLDAPVPTCPGWLVRDLLSHAGGVHRWAASHVAGRRPKPLTPDEVAPLFAAPGDDKLVEWYRDGHAELVATLSGADAASASGPVGDVPAAFAADGIDELLFGFFSRPVSRLVADPPRSLAVRATDVDAAWTVHIEPQTRRVTAGLAPADLTVAGPASRLYLLLWNRRDESGLAIDGDPGVLDVWRSAARVMWG